MRTGSVAEVYEWVVQDVVTKVQELFAREGVDPVVLHELRTLWTSKLREEKVYGREEDNTSRHGGQRPAQARVKAEDAQRLTPKVPVASHPTGTPTNPSVVPVQHGTPTALGMPLQGAQPYGQPGVPQYTPAQMVAPVGVQPGNIQVPQTYGAVVPIAAQGPGVQVSQGTAPAAGQGGPGNLPPAGVASNMGLPPGTANLGPVAPLGTMAEDGAADKGGAVESVKLAGDGNQQTGVKIEPVEPADVKSATPAQPGGDGNGGSGPDKKRKHCEEGDMRNGSTNGGRMDAGQEPSSKVQRINGKSAPEDKVHKGESGSKDGDDEEDDEDLPTDDDDDDMEDPPNFLTAQYEKVSRIKNRWRCQLKYGIFHANGKDYLFKNATGDFTF
ncbi:unnamed protein product [Ostreobium quekettii]|uniref:Transcription factor IIA, alpha/beta subunit n=1 Tax=Ostreobium quekettii TaxID=121088 RepID=A0A8S1ITK2_9CHLO|nr:unnamed protein product [Ostreobium quekettii]